MDAIEAGQSNLNSTSLRALSSSSPSDASARRAPAWLDSSTSAGRVISSRHLPCAWAIRLASNVRAYQFTPHCLVIPAKAGVPLPSKQRDSCYCGNSKLFSHAGTNGLASAGALLRPNHHPMLAPNSCAVRPWAIRCGSP